jgi:hypothetical protein
MAPRRPATAGRWLDRRKGANHFFFTATPELFAARRRHRLASRPPLSAPNSPLEQGSPEVFGFGRKREPKQASRLRNSRDSGISIVTRCVYRSSADMLQAGRLAV